MIISIWAINQRKIPTTGIAPAQLSDWRGWCLVSKDFVLLCLLCAFLAQGAFRGKHTWQVLEFFSGKARLSRLAAKCGYPVASFDLENDKGFHNRKKTSKHPFPHRSYMDFNGESGFAPLNWIFLLLSSFTPCNILWCLACSSGFLCSSSSNQPLAGQSFGWLQYVPLGSALMWGHLIGVWFAQEVFFPSYKTEKPISQQQGQGILM